MIKVVVFDWDGVVVDSMHAAAKGISKVAALYGVLIEPQAVYDGFFQPFTAYYRSIGVRAENEEQLTKRHRAIVDPEVVQGALFPDAFSTLSRLSDAGILLGIATQRLRKDIVPDLERFKLSQFFGSRVKSDEIDKVQKIRELVTETAINTQELLFVGDLPTDVNSGKAAGVLTAGISASENGRMRLEKANPDYLISNLSELITICRI